MQVNMTTHLGLAIWDFVDPEPFVGCTDKSWKVSFYVLDVVESGSEGVVDVDDEDLDVNMSSNWA